MKALAVKVDVANEQDIKSAVDLAVKEFGRLDVMVRDHLELSLGPSTHLSFQFNNAGKSATHVVSRYPFLFGNRDYASRR